MTDRVLVAGVGNIFLGDDGFGVEVARRLAFTEVPDGVRVADYGTSGMHLAYDIAGGYETTILIDAAPRGGPPGTLTVLEAGPEDRPDRGARGATSRRGQRNGPDSSSPQQPALATRLRPDRGVGQAERCGQQ